MLVLSRQRDESVVIDVPPSDKVQRIVVTCVDIRGDKCRFGFSADKSIAIHRLEVREAIDRENARAAETEKNRLQ